MNACRFFKQVKKALPVILGFAAILLHGNPACCQDEDLSTQLGAVLKFSAGIVSAFMIHEGAHYLAGEMTGTDIDWELGNYNQPIGYTEQSENDTDGVIVNSAGLVSQVIGSEIILQVDRIDKNDNFVRGMMTWNILNPVFYALDYWFIHITNDRTGDGGYQGDIQGIEQYSSEQSANVFAASMVALAGIQGYRFLKTQDWAADWFKDESHSLSFAPVRSGGFLFNYTIQF
jgi:hypothetical protein